MGDPCCPNCGAEVYWDFTCHTWFNGEIWMACMNCDSAVEYICSREYSCWTYTDGLNSRSPRAEENSKKRPEWLSKEFEDKFSGADTRVKNTYDYNE
jgi:phage terminase large subunit GpA-like protein